jgi:hypothetical protein
MKRQERNGAGELCRGFNQHAGSFAVTGDLSRSEERGRQTSLSPHDPLPVERGGVWVRIGSILPVAVTSLSSRLHAWLIVRYAHGMFT